MSNATDVPFAHFNTPTELNAEFNATVAVTYAIFGVFMWDWARSFWTFELPMYMRQRKWQWPLILYYLNRFVAALFLVFTIIANAGYMGQTSFMGSVSCDRMVQAILAFAVIQATLSSLVLALRAMALWEMRWDVVAFLTFLMVAQFSLAVPVIATIPWTPGFPKGAPYCGNALTISDYSHLYCAINYLLTAVVDLIVFAVTVGRLSSKTRLNTEPGSLRNQAAEFWIMLTTRGENLHRPRPIAQLLVEQGAIFVLLTLVFNLPVMILEFIHLNGQAVYVPYNIGVPMNAIISCHIITSLYEHNNPINSGFLSSRPASRKKFVFERMPAMSAGVHMSAVGRQIESNSSNKKVDVERDGMEW